MTLEKVYDELISMIEDLRSGQRLADSAIADLQKETQGAQLSTGNPIEINAAPVNVKSLTVTLTPNQTGSGDPSPTNIRPIIGYTECDVDDVGKNRFTLSNIFETGKYINSSGGFSDSQNYNTYKFELDPNQYVISKYDNSTAIFQTVFSLACFDANDTLISNTLHYSEHKSSTDRKNIAFEYPQNAAYVLISLRVSSYDIQLEQGSTATPYEPYHSSNATIQFGQTVYGGSVDFKTGVVTITDANIASYDGETLPSTWISDRDVYAAGTTPTTGAQVCYKLATPQTIQLTPAELKLLKGTNNISVDGNAVIDIAYLPNNVLGQILAESEAYADSVVTITPALESGTKLADYTISGTAGIIYGPGETQATRKTTTKKSTKEE